MGNRITLPTYPDRFIETPCISLIGLNIATNLILFMADDLSLLDYPIGIFPLAYFLAFFVLYHLIFVWGNKNDDAEKIKRKLSVIEAKLDLFMTKQDCHNCHHTLQYPSIFSGQMQCPKCSTIVDTQSQ
jgi:hypothetical protein